MDLEFSPAPAGALIRYTTDGSDPDAGSPVYSGPVPLDHSATVKARLFTASGFTSRVDVVAVERIEAGQGGLLCHYYENDPTKVRWKKLPDLHAHTPVLTRTVSSLSLDDLARRDEHFGALFHGRINVPESGEYTFTVVSDDGAELRIDDRVVIADKLKHPPREATGEPLVLEAGVYTFELHYFQDRRTRALELYYSFDGGQRQPVPFSWFSYD
jgi:hexosaminidase